MFQKIAAEQLKINIDGMIILLAWAIGNIIVGLLLVDKNKRAPRRKAFFQANAAWNVVNLVLALGSIFMLSRIIPAHMQLKETIYTFFNFEKLVLLNVGLDIAYVAIGSFLYERGRHTKHATYEGFGRALWLQGGFLFLLDICLYVINMYYNQKYAVYILF